jgi:hypothetical protein
LKYSKHFNSLLRNCSKTFGFLRNCMFQGSVEKGSVAFFNTLLVAWADAPLADSNR